MEEVYLKEYLLFVNIRSIQEPLPLKQLEIYQCFMAGFDVWFEKLSKNAPKNVIFLTCFFIKV